MSWPAFDITLPEPRVEPSPRWVRVRGGGEWLADSRRALLLAWYGPGTLPTYLFPPEDVRTDLLAPAAQPGEGPMEEHDVRVGGHVLERAAGLFADPPPGLEEGRGMWTFAWDGSVTWLEEALEVTVHAKDTRHRVDTVPSERHVRVELEGEVLADSHRPHALFETTLPTRWYLPSEDVRHELLEPSHTVSHCPFKGAARYWSVRAGGRLHPDLVWSYPEPIPENPRIAGRFCFLNEKVDLTIDGEPQKRPFTPWSL